MMTSTRRNEDSSPGGRAVNLWFLAAASLGATFLTGAIAGAEQSPAVIQIYNGLGTPARACLWGRVLEDKGPRPAGRKSRWYRKIKRNIDALESDEIPHARLTIQTAGRSASVTADKEGLFRLELAGPLPAGSHEVQAKLEGGRPYRVAPGRLLIWPAAAKGKPGPVAVISDIDDTVLRTGVADKPKLALRVLTSDVQDLQTFAGAPALFSVWAGRGYPVVFVSGSPVNLYPKLTGFLALRGFPAAPVLLKDFGGRFALTEQVAYKLAHIKEVARLLPGYRFLLVGDSGESDPEIYHEVRKRYPGRVVAIMIQRVAGKQRTAAELKALGTQLFFDGYGPLARELRRRKLLTAAEQDGIVKGGGEGAAKGAGD